VSPVGPPALLWLTMVRRIRGRQEATVAGGNLFCDQFHLCKTSAPQRSWADGCTQIADSVVPRKLSGLWFFVSFM
jgi:hypothetical protein